MVQHTGADLQAQLCPPRGVQPIGWFLAMRVLTTWLTVDSTKAVDDSLKHTA